MTRPATPLELAEAHLAGGYRDDDEFPRLCSCRKCGDTFDVDFEHEPTAFCNGCAFDVLDVIAAELVRVTERIRVADSTRDAAQVTSNRDLQDRRFAFDVIRMMLASASPNAREHPSMHRAWTTAEQFLKRGY